MHNSLTQSKNHQQPCARNLDANNWSRRRLDWEGCWAIFNRRQGNGELRWYYIADGYILTREDVLAVFLHFLNQSKHDN